VERLLGEGGMSYVYEATDMHSGKSLAVKVLSPKLSKDATSVERLRREAGLAIRLDHPNICRILRLGETEDGLIYLVMPYLKGELLSDRETRTGPMSAELGVEYLAQICSGLHFAHRQNIIHRDLKPENIMMVPGIDGGEIPVIMDFGLAKQNRADPSVAKLTATGIILGTPEFMSPEQIRGHQIDARSDVYSLGIVGYEMFTKYRSDFPPRLEGALMKSMESDPRDRYQTAFDFGQGLVDALGGEVAQRLGKFLR
jgi:serine/threonine-protein kinase